LPEAGGSGHPPCPSSGAPPPGHNKGADPQDRPCKGGKSDQANGSDAEGNGSDSKANDKAKEKDGAGQVAGGVVLMPLGLAGLAATVVRRLDRRGRTRRRPRLRLRGRRRAR